MKTIAKTFAAGLLSVAMLFGAVAPVSAASGLTASQVQSILSLLSSFGADAATIANVQAALNGEATSGTGSSSNSGTGFQWTRNLTIGDTGNDVLELQKFLNSDPATRIASSGVGSPGNETNYYGSLTAAAVAKFQEKYASDILAPLGLSKGTGYFGTSTRAKANALNAGSSSNDNGNNNPPVVSGNGLSVSLAPDSPNGSALVQGQAIAELAKFKFVNQNSTDMKITNLTFNRIGVSNDDTLTDVYLYNGASRLTDSAAVTNSQFSYNEPAGIFTIPAGSSMMISVRSNIAANTNGQQVGAELVSVGASGPLDASVSLPIRGGLQTISAADLATVDFNATTLPTASSADPQTDFTIWQNTVTVGTTDVDFESFTLEQIGSVKPGDITNMRLYVDGKQVGNVVDSTKVVSGDDVIVFDMTSNPVRLATGGRVIKVVGDIVGGSSDTFAFSLRRASDARFVDTELHQPVTATANGSTFTARTATTITVNAGTMSVTKANNSPTDSIATNATNVLLASFEFRASGEDVKVNDLNVKALTTGANGGLENGRIFVNGSQVGSTKDLTEETDVNFTFGSSFIARQGEVEIVDIYADAKTTTGASYSAGDTIQIQLSAGSSNGEGQDSSTSVNVPSSNVTGNTISFASSSLTATKFSGYGDQTLIAGTNNALLGSFTLSAGTAEGVNVNTIEITMSSANAASITDLVLKDHATGAQLGTSKVTPSTSNSFSVNFDIPDSQTKTIDVYGNIKSGADDGDFVASVGTATNATGLVTGNSVSPSAATLQTITFGAGTLSVSVGPDDPNSDNVIAGASKVFVGQFNFAAANSEFAVRELQIKVPNDASTSITNVTLSYINSQGQREEKSQALVLSSGDGTANFTGLDFIIPADDDRNLDVYVGTTLIPSGGKSGAAISVTFDHATEFKAIDSAGTTKLSVGSADVSAGGTFYLRESIPTFGKATAPTATPTAGVALYEFPVTADAAGPVEWKKLTFNVTTNGATLTGFYLREKGESTNINDSTVDANGSGKVVIYAGTQANNDVEQIGAGSTKTYQLYATAVTGWGTSGDSLSINLAEDTSFVANTNANALDSGNNIIWSDRSATSHTTATSDWTNSFQVDDLTGGDAISYSQS